MERTVEPEAPSSSLVAGLLAALTYVRSSVQYDNPYGMLLRIDCCHDSARARGP